MDDSHTESVDQDPPPSVDNGSDPSVDDSDMQSTPMSPSLFEDHGLVAVSTAGSSEPRAVCHEIAGDPDDENIAVNCNTVGEYRSVDPTVYPHRRPCSRDECWADGVPDAVATDD